MDWYGFFKLLHVGFSVAWVGGGFTLMVAAEVMRRNRGPRGALAIVDAVALLGLPFFVPVSLATVLFGIAAAWFGPGFTELWVILGLVGFAATFLNGLLMIKPRAERISTLLATEEPDSPPLVQAAEALMMISRFDYVMLGLVITVMVLKPSASNTWLLALMAAVLVAGASLTLGRALRRTV